MCKFFDRFSLSAFVGVLLVPLSAGCSEAQDSPAVEETPASYNVLCLGNSITRHEYAESVEWYSDWGMAASKPENDYCHVLESLLNGKYPGSTVTPLNIAAWERSLSGQITCTCQSIPILFKLVGGRIGARDVATRRHISEKMPMSTRTRTVDSLPHLGLPAPFSVPQAQGRTFMDLFYWDTYFTNLGLLSLGDIQQAKNNVDDILYLIDKYGYMPNAANTGLLNRSQPPYASMMVRDVYERTDDRGWLRGAVETLKKEYDFWMTERVTPSGLNRHFNSATRTELLEFYGYLCSERFPEMDVPRSDDEKVRIASNFLSEAESGWDFTPRFGGCEEDCNPVDLNANLYVYEKNFAWFCRELGLKGAKAWEKKAEKRRRLIQKYCFEPGDGLFYDYNYVTGRRSDVFSSAVFNLLWAGIPTEEQAASLVKNLGRLECANGVAACEDGERNAVYQWDYPNAWASFNTLAVVGLDKYGYKADAARLAEKYLNSVSSIYGKTGQLWEKYNAVTGDTDVRDEYAMPGDFMGWTAGAFLVCFDYLSKN